MDPPNCKNDGSRRGWMMQASNLQSAILQIAMQARACMHGDVTERNGTSVIYFTIFHQSTFATWYDRT